MANNCLNWVTAIHADRDTGLKPTEKLVLLVMADGARKNGETFEGSPTLARKCGIGERYLRIIHSRLERFGLLGSEAQYRPNGSESTRLRRLKISVDPLRWRRPSIDGKPVDDPLSEVRVRAFFATLRKLMIAAGKSPKDFETWLAPLRPLGIMNGKLHLAVPSKFPASKIRHEFASWILEAARAELSTMILRFHLNQQK